MITSILLMLPIGILSFFNLIMPTWDLPADAWYLYKTGIDTSLALNNLFPVVTLFQAIGLYLLFLLIKKLVKMIFGHRSPV